MNYFIHQCIAVGSFSIDKEIKYKLKQTEDAFKAIIKAQVTSTNAHDLSPPDAPRLILESHNKQIAITQTSAQLVLTFEKTGKSIEDCFEIISKNLLEFKRGFDQLIPDENRKEFGLVLSIRAPSKIEKDILHDKLFDKFLKSKKQGSISTFEVKYGFVSEDNLFKNYMVNVYQLRKSIINPVDFESPTFIKVNELPVAETGIAVLFDVNDRPKYLSENKADGESFSKLLETLKAMTFDELPDLLNIEI